MTFEFKLPDLGEGIHEAEVISLKVAQGQNIAENAPLMEVETDKALVEIPSPVGGVVDKIHVKEGQIVKVGMTMVTFTPNNQVAKAANTELPKAKPEPVQVQSGKVQSNNLANTMAQSNGPKTNGRVLAAPSTRRLARELNIDLTMISGSGPAGRILASDLTNTDMSRLPGKLNLGEAVPEFALYEETMSVNNRINRGDFNYNMPDFQKYGLREKQPLKSVRAKIAQHMSLSWAIVPHVTHFDEVEVSDLQNMLADFQRELAKENIKITLTAIAIKAITAALIKFPEFNSSLNDTTNEIILKKYYNIGVAVATDRGLLVPVIYNTNAKSLRQIAVELSDTINRTRTNKIKPEELQGGTFTITNIGVIGGTSMSPMVNYPECAILGMATIKQQPIVKDNKIEVGNVLPIALSFDHRITDGANAAHFISYFRLLLSKPHMLLLD